MFINVLLEHSFLDSYSDIQKRVLMIP